MSLVRQKIGRSGEDAVAHLLSERGFRIVARNWRCRYGELDLLCSREDMLYVIEVKTRTSRTFGFPEEAVTPAKRERMQRCVGVFLAQTRTRRYRHVVFQVAAVIVEKERIIIRLFTGW